MNTVQKAVRMMPHCATHSQPVNSKNLNFLNGAFSVFLQLSNQNQDSMGLHMQSEHSATGTRIQDFLQNLSNERVQLHSTTLEDCISNDRPKNSRHFQHVYPTSIKLGSGQYTVTCPLTAMRLAERARCPTAHCLSTRDQFQDFGLRTEPTSNESDSHMA